MSRCSKLTDMTILIICYLYLCLILCALQVFIPKSHRSCSPLHSLFGLWNAAPEQHPIWWQLILNIYSEKYQNETWHGMVAGFIFNNGAATVLLCIAWMFFSSHVDRLSSWGDICPPARMKESVRFILTVFTYPHHIVEIVRKTV